MRSCKFRARSIFCIYFNGLLPSRVICDIGWCKTFRHVIPQVVETAASDFQVIDGAGLSALPDVADFLTGFSAIVVASDHGGMLTAAELSFLNANSGVILDYLNAGGGLYAEAESNARGLIGATPRFGFLPFLVSSTDFQSAETSNTVTPFGASQFGLIQL